EFRLSSGMPRLLYVKAPAPEREPPLEALLESFAADPSCTYKLVGSPDELGKLLGTDLALLLSERFQSSEALTAPTAVIPSPATSFVGRISELERIDELLMQEGGRLLTFAGRGGTGKTRLAIEAARGDADRSKAGEVFLPLDGIGDPALVLPTLAAELGREPGSDPLEALIAHLRTRSLLLVLDNFEHVIKAAPALGALLERTSELKVLVTSRELLRLRGGHEVAVPPLATDREAVPPFEGRA